MTDAGIEKRLWLLERDIKDLGKKIDALSKSTLDLRIDIRNFLSVQKTWKELVDDESGK